uniref:Ribonuclease H-like domain-containing protein n=1 Tax=Tanacetum cinerariifolium TaxID=118510 RepID=A0A6L2LDN2_TANCI|nr:ribonuclease H-like domain-containing protein [Tanacetum cinerariifolium]
MTTNGNTTNELLTQLLNKLRITRNENLAQIVSNGNGNGSGSVSMAYHTSPTYQFTGPPNFVHTRLSYLVAPTQSPNMGPVQQVQPNMGLIQQPQPNFNVGQFTYNFRNVGPCTGDLYPITTPFPILHAFLVNQHMWHQRLGHLRSEVLRRLVSQNFISCSKEKPPALFHACQLGKHVRLPFASADTVVTSCFDIIYSDLDVKNAFLHRDLFETLYMHQPPGFQDSTHPDYVCLLQRSLYGLKQAPRALFWRFPSCITRVGFQSSRCDSSLFIYRQGTDTAYLLLYVDDIMLTASSETLLQQIISLLHQGFSMTDLGSLNYFLGISVTCDFTGMFLSQRQYVVEILERAGMVGCNSSRTPVDTESKLGVDGDQVFDLTFYRSLAGSLQYLTFTRPDISFEVQQDTLDYGLQLFFLLLQIWLPTLIAEAEYHGVTNAVAETCWLRNLLRELHTPLFFATLVYCDNVSVVYLSCNLVQHQHKKHIEIDIQFVRDLVAAVSCLFTLSVCRYFHQRLPSVLFEEFRFSLSVRSLLALTAGEY